MQILQHHRFGFTRKRRAADALKIGPMVSTHPHRHQSPRGGPPRIPRVVLALFVSAAPLQAFPPAPYYTIFGDVKDQYGQRLPAEGCSVILYQSGREILRQSMTTNGGGYQLRMRIDMFRSATSAYSSAALKSGSDYSLSVSVNGLLYQPIEMKTAATVGSAADRRRLDLTLGVDSDGDGLPDAWEESQLYEAGQLPGPEGWDLSLVDRNGDLDGDGVINWNEYLAGTGAGDPRSRLSLEIKEITTSGARLEFYALYGRIYELESSTDLKNWSAAEFTPADAAGPTRLYQADTSGIVSLFTPQGGPKTYYRLSVR